MKRAVMLGGVLFLLPVWSQTTTQAQIEPGAGNWRTWVISAGKDYRVPPPPDAATTQREIQWLREFMAQADAQTRDQIDYWDVWAPGWRWVDLVSQRTKDGRVPIPEFARVSSLVTVAIYDATVAAWDSKYAYNRAHPAEVDGTLLARTAVPRSPSYPSEHAAAAAAAAGVLAFLYPNEAAYFNQLAEEAGRARLAAGVRFTSDVTAGHELGRAVAARVIEYARNDGRQTPWAGTIPGGPGFWVGVNPVFANAQSWKPWVLSQPSEFRPGPPPAFNSPETLTGLAEIRNFPRDFNSNAKAFFWQTPEGTSTWFLDEVSLRQFEFRLDSNPPKATRAYALVAISWFEALMASHDAKMTYFRARPNMLDPAINTLFANPNHPSYPANQAMSAVRAGVLAYLFPRYADYYRQIGEEAGWSRLWAGIHHRSDIETSFVLARQVLRKILDRAEGDGSR
jgi:membrane-associated phospholipid phosphatase